MKTIFAIALLLAALVSPARAQPHIAPDGYAILQPYALTLSTAVYATGELVGTHTGGKLEFRDAVRVPGGFAEILSACLVDQSKSNTALDLILFSGVPTGTTFTDNATLDIADGDAERIVAQLSFAAADYKSFSDNSAVCAANLGQGYAVPASTVLYGALIARGALTPAAATDYTLRLIVKRS